MVLSPEGRTEMAYVSLAARESLAAPIAPVDPNDACLLAGAMEEIEAANAPWGGARFRLVQCQGGRGDRDTTRGKSSTTDLVVVNSVERLLALG
jgi:hypothetical protein